MELFTMSVRFLSLSLFHTFVGSLNRRKEAENASTQSEKYQNLKWLLKAYTDLWQEHNEFIASTMKKAFSRLFFIFTAFLPCKRCDLSHIQKWRHISIFLAFLHHISSDLFRFEFECKCDFNCSFRLCSFFHFSCDGLFKPDETNYFWWKKMLAKKGKQTESNVKQKQNFSDSMSKRVEFIHFLHFRLIAKWFLTLIR